MEFGDYHFKKPELLQITEDIYQCKCEKQDLLLELDIAKFHYKYIPIRKDRISEQSIVRILVSLPFILFWFLCLFLVIYCIIKRTQGIIGIFVLAAEIYIIFGGYYLFKILKEQIISVQKYVQADEQKATEHIKYLEEQIRLLEEKQEQLEQRQNELIEEKIKTENILREKGILFDELPDKEPFNFGFSLRADARGSLDIRELFDAYQKEEASIRREMEIMDRELSMLNKEIVKIDEDFEKAKKMIYISLIVFLFMIIIQSSFNGYMEVLTNFICLFIGLIAVFMIEKKVSHPILNYLIENDSDFVKEYVFRNDIIPLYQERKNMLKKMAYVNLELEEIQKKKKMLDID